MKDLILLVHKISRFTLAFIWIYHGLVPKILFRHKDELQLIAIHNLPFDTNSLLYIGGIAEILFGILFLFTWRFRWPFVISIVALFALLIDISIHAPHYLISAFNPVSFNVAVIALSLIGYTTVNNKEK